MTGRRGRARVRDLGVAACDLSTARTGVVDAGGVARSIVPLGRGVQERNATIALRVLQHVLEARVLIVEDLLKGARFRGQHELAKLHGSLEHAAWSAEIPVGHIHPSTLKKYATGRGRDVDKAAMLEAWLQARPPAWIPHPHDDDQVDALWLWAAAVHHYSRAPIVAPTAYRVEVAAGLELPRVRQEATT